MDAKAPKDLKDFPVVGIGASAGGLDAYKRLLSALPERSGAAFILIQHLDPDHESMMAELLARHTPMAVLQAENDMHMKPDTIYVIPPGKFIRLVDQGLFLDDPVKEHGIRLSIDYFFRSLAEVRGEKSIGVVLSGTGSDGTVGIREIKAAGGMVMVQHPEQAEYDGMPRSAIATGLVDFVLPVEQMGERLVQFLRHPYVDRPDPLTGLSDLEPDRFRSVLMMLRSQTGYDFLSYKKATVERRIQRRMGLKQFKSLDEYVGYLRESPEEVTLLFRDLLIGVTRFFREPDAWRALQGKAIGPLLTRLGENTPIRAWVPGCSSGEEAYTLAMAIFDCLDRQHRQPEVQIFATDLNSSAIEAARAGRYPSAIAADIPEQVLRKYFIRDGDYFRVGKRLRESVVFATQNVISDPPFSKLDIVTCRNLMIYLEADVQKRMIEMFHFALAPDGFLFLGNSETAERPGRLFKAVDKSNRIYRRAAVAHSPTGRFPIVQPQGPAKEAARDQAPIPGSTVIEQAKRHLLDRYVPASVLVGPDQQVRYFHGPVRNYFDFPTGEPSSQIGEIAIQGLRSKLRTVLTHVQQGQQSAEAVAHKVRRDGAFVSVRISAESLSAADGDDRAVVVTFEDVSAPQTVRDEQAERDERRKKYDQEQINDIEALEYELLSTREDLQSTIEEMDTANEELKASNEEVMSMNEELQSTNEELETSREELQSLNEELSTVNSQLEDKVREVEQAVNDLTNLLTSTNIAVIFLDTDMVIRRFTPAIKEIMRIIDTDVGRPVEDIALRVQDASLLEDARACLQSLTESEAELETENGAYLIRRLRPYRTSDHRIEGVVVTYTDVTNLRDARDQARHRAQQQASVTELGRLALAGTSLDALLQKAVEDVAVHLNLRFVKVLQLDPDGRTLTLRTGVGWREGLVGKARVENGVNSQAGYTLLRTMPVVVEDFAEEKRFSAPPILTDHGIVCGASVLIGPVEAPWGVLGAHDNVRGRCAFSVDDVNYLQTVANVLWQAIAGTVAQQAIEGERRQLRNLTDSLPIEISILDRDLCYEFMNASYDRNGFDRSAHLGGHVRDLIGPEGFAEAAPHLEEALQGKARSYELTLARPGKPVRHEIVTHTPRRDEAGNVTGIYTAAIDITRRRKLEQEVIERTEQYRIVGEAIPFGVWICDAEGRLVYVSDSFLEMVGKSFEEVAEFGWADRLRPGTAEDTLAAWDACRKGEQNWEREHEFVTGDGDTVHVLAVGRPVRGPDGTVVSWVGLNLDITRRKKEQQRLAIVSAELDHRVKNILATVSTIARMTGRTAGSLDAYRDSLEKRLQALSAAHQILAESEWEGMDLEQLLRTELNPYLLAKSNITIAGPAVFLRPGTAQSMALAFHELVTNAAKYGGLVVEGGSVSVSWRRNENGQSGIHLLWRESGLDNLEKPDRAGFGTTVLEQVLAAQLGADVALAYKPTGLEVSISLPVEALRDEA